eukprot:TRINITY_DN7013_c0_g1_i1.p1 TRINITY_DN7013_c0_g1~~TRINITY_DN7013_c0_g1_i1.p1  ORF type:complete len:753 (+),score=196.67 TRINITY_DN7013_c0_g1_i1:68-2260(+)
MSILDGDSVIGEPITIFIIQLVFIMLLCRLLSFLFRYIKQPAVIAEVVAGILLGPSVFGKIPHFTETIFPTQSTHVFNSVNTLNVFANVGLIAFMFLVGLELDAQLLRRNVKKSVIISISAMIGPFVLGLASSVAVYNVLIPSTTRFTNFLLFVAVALSITAFPVLARILAETRLLDDRVGNIALSSAAVDDVVAWCLLALVVAIARAHSPLSALYTFLVLAGFIVVMFFPVRMMLLKVAHRSGRQNKTKIQVIAFMLVLMFICAWFTEIIGVHSIFGSFILGVITPREHRFAINITERIEDFIVIVLLPLYFTYSGLRTNINSIASAKAWGLTVLIIITACVGKIGAGTLAARFTGNTWRESFTVGVLMNTKGLVELIVLNLGLDVGVLTIEVFTMFVIMALVTTFLTTPLVHFIYLRYKRNNVIQKENYPTVMFVPDQKTGTDMVAFCAAVHPDQTQVKAIVVNEISDRPSSYFFHLSGKLKQDVPFFKDRTKKDMLSSMKKFASTQGIVIKSKVLSSVHLAEDISTTAENYICQLIMIGVNGHFDDLEEEQRSLQRGASRLSVALELGLEQMIGSDSPTAKVISSSIHNITSPLGIFVSKAQGANVVGRAAVIYTGRDFEQAVFQFVLQMRKTVAVDFFTSEMNLDFDPHHRENIKVIHTDDPVATMLEAQKSTPYHITVVSAPRQAMGGEFMTLARGVVSNVLTIFPALVQPPPFADTVSERSDQI